jgi:hypothetical protein
MSESTLGAVELKPLAVVPWSPQVPLEVVETGPMAGDSFLELPGPIRLPERPHLNPFVSDGGVAALLQRADGQVFPLILSCGKEARVHPVAEAPLAVSRREDGGVWMLTQDHLTHCNEEGQALDKVAVTGHLLVGSARSAVWVVDLQAETARLVDAGGQIRGEYGWTGGPGSAPGDGGALCALHKSQPFQVRCLRPNGEEESVDLPARPRPAETLLAWKRQGWITRSGATFRRYGPGGGLQGQLTVQSAGLTGTGDLFLSGREGAWVNLWINRGLPQRLPLPAHLPEWGAFAVAAVEGGLCLVSGLDFAAWYRGAEVQETFVVDEDSYRARVFPHLWSLGGLRCAAATPAGTVILSVTGPAGVALIELTWDQVAPG